MSEATFDTLLVASAVTGVALCKMRISDMCRVAAHVLGHPVWTHEFAERALYDRIDAAVRAQFPLMPTKAEATANFEGAAAAVLTAYGKTVTLAAGSGSRTEGPVESLARITGRPEDILVVKPEPLN